MRSSSRIGTVATTLLVLVTVGCGGGRTTQGDAQLGKELVNAYGCGGCHEIADVAGADGQVGPSLQGLRDRRVIAGSLPNTPENVARWIGDPKSINPDTLMPDLGVSPTQAKAIADYLYEH
jgi:cytochrome c2